jgi:hypothetical protein
MLRYTYIVCLVWYTTPALPGSRLPAPTSGNFKCCNPDVFLLRLNHLCYVGKTHIHEDLGVPTQSFWCRGASQCSSFGRYLCCPRIDQIHVRRFLGRVGVRSVGAARKRRPGPHTTVSQQVSATLTNCSSISLSCRTSTRL